ncbi:hypothetical protein BRADI_4g20567v3 [Brachypodium distachyon]|uniref:Uncharacterized protein n=1 Tax=Brachypodium distachyon TaxID=15368 RepID=A0A2K2CNX3_BRADI|nr:hypothetical protein BRADI_4g20567v3 [Brachypodium distachyon]
MAPSPHPSSRPPFSPKFIIGNRGGGQVMIPLLRRNIPVEGDVGSIYWSCFQATRDELPSCGLQKRYPR